jgi:hypothetical protein
MLNKLAQQQINKRNAHDRPTGQYLYWAEYQTFATETKKEFQDSLAQSEILNIWKGIQCSAEL